MKLRPILTDHCIDVIERLSGGRRGLPQIVQHGLQTSAYLIYVFERGLQLWTILLNQPTRIGKHCGKVGSILRAQNVIDAAHCNLQLDYAIVKRLQQLLCLRPMIGASGSASISTG